MEESGPPPSRLRRWRWWLAALVLLIAARAALPYVLRRVAVSQAKQNLRADVELGNVDLYLWRGGVVLEDFALRPLPPQGAASEAPEPALDGPKLPAIVAFKRLAVGLSFRPLFDKTIQLYELVVETPRIALDRLENGDLNVMAILPPGEQPAVESPAAMATPGDGTPPAAPAAAGESGAGWRFGVDRVALIDGNLTFLDHMMAGSEPVDIGIPTIEVRDIALDPQVYGGPSNFHVKVLLDDGGIDLGARLRLAADGTTALESELEAQNLPLRRARIYVPEVGWSALRGQLDASLRYRLETGAANELRGTVTLRDVAVDVPNHPDAALAWRSFSVSVDPVDLLAQSATVTEVALDGAVLTVEPQGQEQLPVLARQRAAQAIAAAVAETPVADAVATASPGAPAEEPATPAGAAPTPAEGAATPEPSVAAEAVTGAPVPTPDAAAEAADAAPWHWSVAAVHVTNSLVRLTGSTPAEVRVTAEIERFSDVFANPGHVDLHLAVGEGSLQLAGDLRLEPPGFGGTLSLHRLSLPELIAASGAVAESPLLGATLDADIAIAAGMETEGVAGVTGATDLRLSGSLAFNDLAIKPPGMGDSSVAVRTFGFRFTPLELPGALALALAQPGGIATPGDVRLNGELTLAEPHVQLAEQQLDVAARDIRLAFEPIEVRGVLAPAGAPAAAGKGDVRGQLTLNLAQPRVKLADGKEFDVGAKEIQLALSKLELPGVAAGRVDDSAPRIVAVRELRLDTPAVRITRTEQGLVLPGAKPAAVAVPATPPAADAAAAEPAEVEGEPAPADDVATAPAAPAPGAPLEFTMTSFRLASGRIDIEDRAVKPPFKGTFADLDIRARDLRWPDLIARGVRLSTRTPGNGEIEIEGDISSGAGTVTFAGRKIDLTSFNPYAKTYSPFSITSGALTLETKVGFESETWDLGNSITLQQLDLGGSEGQSLFEKQFGIPLATGLALLKDARGEIAMDIPIQMDREGTKIDVIGIAGAALRRALVNALTSPLRLLGAVTGSGDKIESLAPAAVGFRRGRVELVEGGETRLQQLGAFLASRPGMAVVLETAPTQSDARWLHEQSLRAQWEDEGLFAAILSLGQRGEKARVQAALAARAQDDPGDLSPEDAKLLDEWLASVPPATPGQLAALAAARLSQAEGIVRSQPSVDPARVTTAGVPPELGEGPPEVRVVLGTATQENEAPD